MSTTTLAIGSVYGTQLTRNELIRRAFELATLKNVEQVVRSANKVSQAADFLQMELMALQAHGVQLHTADWQTLTTVADTDEYSAAAQGAIATASQLPGDTLDLTGTATVYLSGEVPTPVEQITAEQWATTRDNGFTTGRPVMYFVNRTIPLKINLWPTPDAAYTFRYRQVRLLKDASTGASTPELQAYWHMFLLYKLAFHLAMANGIDSGRVGMLAGQAKEYFQTAKAYSRARGPIQMRSTHQGPW